MSDINDCVRPVVDDCFLLQADSQRAMNDTCAALWREQRLDA
jgi:hypothetical protein